MSSYITPTIAAKKPIASQYKIILYTGLALFAMFFGAGNIVFPLYLGANCGENILPALFGFLLAGVGVPFLGLMAISLYKGDYFAFFARLGTIPAWLLLTIIMIALGPFGAMPRTETTTFNTLLPYLPDFLKNNTVFSLVYCSLVLLLSYRETKVIKILGLFLSPVKIISFTALVFIGLVSSEQCSSPTIPAYDAFHKAVLLGYNTMDLLAGIFFCTMAFRSIQTATSEDPSLSPAKLTLKACVLGALIISLVYSGFMLVAYKQAAILQGLGAEQTIATISNAVLGKFGGLFVCIAVSFACVATTIALGQACSQCIYQDIFKKRIPKQACFLLTIFFTYLMSNLGFQGIAKFSSPLITIIYPALIVLCILNILYKLKGFTMVKLPVLLTVLISILFSTL